MAKLVIDGKLSLDVLKHFLTSNHWSFQTETEADSKWSRPLKAALGTSNQADEVGTSREIFRVQRKGMGWLGGWVGMCQDCECWTILKIEATRSIHLQKSQSKQCGNSHNAINNYQLGMIYTNIY